MTTSHYVVVDCRMCQEFYYIPATPAQQEELDKPRSERAFMQDIFPELSVGDRELLISGTCNTCWDKLFPSNCMCCDSSPCLEIEGDEERMWK